MRVKLACVFVFEGILLVSLLSAQPSIQWQRCLGGSDDDLAYSIQQTSDGGFILAGVTASNDGDVSGNHGGYDFWVVKLNSSGEIEWQKCLGGSEGDEAYSIQQTADGGFVVAGKTSSNDGDVSGHHPGGYYDSDSIWHEYPDYWVVKLDSAGEIEWQRCLGGSGDDWAESIHQTSDGGFIVAGGTWSYDGDVSGNHGGKDFWVVKLNSSGEIEWHRCLGGSDWDVAKSIQQTSEGGFIVAGYTRSNDGNVSGNHGVGDAWVVKLDSTEAIQWRRSLGGNQDDVAKSIQQTSEEGGFIATGHTYSNDGDVSGNHGGYDYWVVQLNSAGEIQWQKCLGGSGRDYALSIQQTTDGGFIVAGYSESNDGDVSGNHGGGDAWVVKLSPFEGITEAAAKPDAPTIKVSPNPFNSACEISVPAGAEVLIYDIDGNLVHRTAARGGKVIWVPGKTVGSGVYTVRVCLADGKITNRKVVYLK